MSKSTKLKVLPPEADDHSEQQEKTVDIVSAKLADAFCNYSYELLDGPTKGDTINRKSGLIVHDDLRKAFKKLHPHLAVICEEIDAKLINDIDGIEDYDDEIHKAGKLEHRVSHFTVDSFKIAGVGDGEGVVIYGSKRLSTGEYVGLTSPKTCWSENYAFINELRVAIDDLKYEVELYMGGKSAPKMVQGELGLGEPGDDLLNS